MADALSFPWWGFFPAPCSLNGLLQEAYYSHFANIELITTFHLQHFTASMITAWEHPSVVLRKCYYPQGRISTFHLERCGREGATKDMRASCSAALLVGKLFLLPSVCCFQLLQGVFYRGIFLVFFAPTITTAMRVIMACIFASSPEKPTTG